MALILSIDTATAYAGICLSKDGVTLGHEEHADQKNHAAFLQPAIQQLMQQSGLLLTDLDAVAVTGGPGSYTGIRVGLASAKGICYALKKPLIVLNTLQIIALAAHEKYLENKNFNNMAVFYPMIDARRMEVFMGTYNMKLTSIREAEAVILDDHFFASISNSFPVIFCGDGAIKIPKTYINDNNKFVSTAKHSVKHMVGLAEQAFADNNFADLAFSAPFYIKEFYNLKNN